MAEKILDEIKAQHIVEAIRKIEAGLPNRFAESTGYDVLLEGKRYAPKAVVGVAAGILTGEELGPYDFKGGLGSKCFKVLRSNGFVIVTKGDTDPYPDEVPEEFREGRSIQVTVNRFERDTDARRKCLQYYGATCQVCCFDFKEKYGSIGDGFMHVHHLMPLASIGQEYVVDPVADLRPVCPNCHAMLHKRTPPFSFEELREFIK